MAGTVTIAVAGGAGAFLGAVVGQLVQWLRENLAHERTTQLAMERERRDHKRAAYVELIGLASKLPDLGTRQEYLAPQVVGDPDPSVRNEIFENKWAPLEREYRSLHSQALAIALAYGSDKVIEAVRFLGGVQPWMSRWVKDTTFQPNELTPLSGGGFEERHVRLGKNPRAEVLIIFQVHVKLIAETVAWLISQCRYEIQVDMTPPSQQPYEFRIVYGGPVSRAS